MNRFYILLAVKDVFLLFIFFFFIDRRFFSRHDQAAVIANKTVQTVGAVQQTVGPEARGLLQHYS